MIFLTNCGAQPPHIVPSKDYPQNRRRFEVGMNNIPRQLGAPIHWKSYYSLTVLRPQPAVQTGFTTPLSSFFHGD